MGKGTLQSPDTLAEFWKTRFQRQKLLIASITSLFDRYGNSVDVDHLYSTFLLTVMGHYAVGDACYYSRSADGKELVPVLAYGRRSTDSLPSIACDGPLVSELLDSRAPRHLSALGHGVHRGDPLRDVADSYSVVAPLCVSSQLLGMLFLGKRVSGQSFRDVDLEVIYALCAASATTFSNALLYQNAHLYTIELESLSRLRAGLISRVSHEFRTPLTAISAMVEMMEAGRTDPRQNEILRGSVDRLEELIEALLELNSDDADPSPGGPSTYDPVAAIQAAIAKATGGSDNRRVRFTYRQHGGSGLPSPTIAPRDLTRVVDALLDNAIKFSHPGSVVDVVAAAGDLPPDTEEDGAPLSDWRAAAGGGLDTYPPVAGGEQTVAWHDVPGERRSGAPLEWVGPCLVVRVTDQGIGIPAGDIDTISEPFRQAVNSPDIDVKGRGLGLSVVQKIVARCGGRVFCKSRLGAGTTMTVYFPAE